MEGVQALHDALRKQWLVADGSTGISAQQQCEPVATDAHQAWRHPNIPRSIAFQRPGAHQHGIQWLCLHCLWW